MDPVAFAALARSYNLDMWQADAVWRAMEYMHLPTHVTPSFIISNFEAAARASGISLGIAIL